MAGGAGNETVVEVARRIGEVLGRAVLQTWTQLEPLAEPKVRAASGSVELPVARGDR